MMTKGRKSQHCVCVCVCVCMCVRACVSVRVCFLFQNALGRSKRSPYSARLITSSVGIVCVYVCVCVFVCARVCVCVSKLPSMGAGVSGHASESVNESVRYYMTCARARACVCVCARARVGVCVHVHMRE